MTLFKDRRDAGRRLAQALQRYRGTDTVVLALPRGGVPVAYGIAKALDLPLDVLVVRKVGMPGQPELAMGTVAQGGTQVINEDIVRHSGVSDQALEDLLERKHQEVDERLQRFRGGRPLPDVKGRTVLLVDNGVATGSTILAGAQALRTLGPDRIVMAVPVLSTRILKRLQDVADDVVYVRCSDDFYAVGQWYQDFSQTPDDEVVRLLEAAQQETVY